MTAAIDAPRSSSGNSSHWTDNSPSMAAGPEVAAGQISISLDQFLSGLSQSGLLPAAELSSVREKSSQDPAFGTVAGLIEWLVKQGKLTRYQADLLG
ncbi:MAG TPA: hypothetical protein VKE94_14600, partial [Gemmataceae bacterium]|nr:hypothetical protein [Gemmataceae bacterium]